MLENLRGRTNADPQELVFQTTNGTPFSDDNVRRVVKSIGREIGRPDFTTHCFRNTFINLGFEKDANVLSMRSIVGHSKATTTQIYEKASIQRLQKVVESLPRMTMTA